MITRSSAVADKPPNDCCISYYVLPSGEVNEDHLDFTSPEGSSDVHVIFPALHAYAIPFVALTEGISQSYRVHIWYGKTRVTGLQPVEVRATIDSLFGHNMPILPR